MIRLRLAAIAAALALSACRTTAGAVLRVDPPPSEPGAVADAQQYRIARAIRDVVATDRMECREGSGPVLLSCFPADVGTRSAQVTIQLERSGSGYQVSLVESFLALGGPKALCAVQDRLIRGIDAELGVPSAKPDARGRCAGQPPRNSGP
ncbi:conserved hypothetical protein [Anaeromyxobacter sp. K]|uniref:hypothetical protein n=1 Tax=Anaeromyxobacter sp. (strain K) TaxID=447217 RepID=UPI00015F8DD8|nr:hypothetical protein [Anaeromyxobacter sp. K]ACG72608.1 conserved hypothetical protein [Anaeromyxobacter sp. K]